MIRLSKTRDEALRAVQSGKVEYVRGVMGSSPRWVWKGGGMDRFPTAAVRWLSSNGYITRPAVPWGAVSAAATLTDKGNAYYEAWKDRPYT